MLYQLLPHKLSDDIISLTHSYQAPHPLTVLNLVAKYENKRLKDTTVILIVDGLQALMHSDNDGQNPLSEFYHTLT